MVEIYSYDIATHERFARNQQDIEAFRKQYHLPPSSAGIIAAQTKILAFVPKQPAISLLLQTYIRKTWAEFSIPKNYHTQRFGTSYIAPSLGSAEKQKADIQKIEAILRRQTRGRYRRKEKEEEEKGEQPKGEEEEMVSEGEALVNLLEKGVLETNEMVDFIVARMKQFVQA